MDLPAHLKLTMAGSLLRPRQLEVPREVEQTQCSDAIPVQIEFIPGEAMARRLRVCVMVIMPAFTESEHGDPKTVPGCIVGGESPRSPHMRSRVHQPRGVQTNDSAEEDAPHHVLPAD